MRLIYAISPNDNDGLSYHTAAHRGVRSVYLRHSVTPPASNTPQDTVIININITEVSMLKIVSQILQKL